jgi:CARDB protein
MNVRKSIPVVLFMAALFSMPNAQKKEKRDPSQIPGKDSPTADKRIVARAEFCFSSIEGVGPLGPTVDPDGDGCIMHQEYTFGIKNTGIVDAPSSVVQLTITNSHTKEKRVINRRITVLKPGQVVTVPFKFSIVADYYLVKLDAKQEVEEVNESNNQHEMWCSGGVLLPFCK